MKIYPRATTLIAGLLVGSAAAACEKPMIDVYQRTSPECRSDWADYLRDNGFEVTAHDIADFPVDRLGTGVEGKAAACQRALLEGYVIEGYVPASAIIRLLDERPPARGLSAASTAKGSTAPEGERHPSQHVLLVEMDGSSRVYIPKR